MFNIEEQDDVKVSSEIISPLLEKIETEGKVSKNLLLSIESLDSNYTVPKKLLNQLTSKPSELNVKLVKEHLIEICSSNTEYSGLELLKVVNYLFNTLLNKTSDLLSILESDYSYIKTAYVPESLSGKLGEFDKKYLYELRATSIIGTKLLETYYPDVLTSKRLDSSSSLVVLLPSIVNILLEDDEVWEIKVKPYFDGTVGELYEMYIEAINKLNNNSSIILSKLKSDIYDCERYYNPTSEKITMMYKLLKDDFINKIIWD